MFCLCAALLQPLLFYHQFSAHFHHDCTHTHTHTWSARSSYMRHHYWKSVAVQQQSKRFFFFLFKLERCKEVRKKQHTSTHTIDNTFAVRNRNALQSYWMYMCSVEVEKRTLFVIFIVVLVVVVVFLSLTFSSFSFVHSLHWCCNDRVAHISDWVLRFVLLHKCVWVSNAFHYIFTYCLMIVVIVIVAVAIDSGAW